MFFFDTDNFLLPVFFVLNCAVFFLSIVVLQLDATLQQNAKGASWNQRCFLLSMSGSTQALHIFFFLSFLDSQLLVISQQHTALLYRLYPIAL